MASGEDDFAAFLAEVNEAKPIEEGQQTEGAPTDGRTSTSSPAAGKRARGGCLVCKGESMGGWFGFTGSGHMGLFGPMVPSPSCVLVGVGARSRTRDRLYPVCVTRNKSTAQLYSFTV